MPWKLTAPMEEINRFVVLAQSDRFAITELCEQFGISRKTGYKHLDRYATHGLAGLQPRSQRLPQCPQRTAADVETLLLADRRRHRTWGPKELHNVLEVRPGLASPPACSTIGEILRRHGLSAPRRRQPGIHHALNHGLTVPTQPTHAWTVDFKGWFPLGDGQHCDPLTVCDRYSHYVLAVRARADQQFKGTPPAFKALMRQSGVPDVIRVDLLTKPALVEKAWEYFNKEQTKNRKYQPLLGPADQPATWLNTRIMSDHRETMRKFYYNPAKYDTYLEQLGIAYPTVRAGAGAPAKK